jgi:hypothetical protein
MFNACCVGYKEVMKLGWAKSVNGKRAAQIKKIVKRMGHLKLGLFITKDILSRQKLTTIA